MLQICAPFAVVFWIVEVLSPYMTYACDSVAYQACVFNVTVELTVPLHQSAPFPFFSDDELHHICSLQDHARLCFEPISKECNKKERILNAGYTKTAEYLCQDGYNTYREVRHCFLLPTVHDGASRCNTTHFSQKASLLRGKYGLTKSVALLCGYIDEFISCLWKEASTYCDTVAADWLSEVMVRSLQPTKESMNCPSNDSSSHKPLVFPIILGCLVGVLVITVAVLIYNRKRMKYTRGRAQYSRSLSHTRKSSINASKSCNDPQTSQPFIPASVSTTDQSTCVTIIDNEGKTTSRGVDSGEIVTADSSTNSAK